MSERGVSILIPTWNRDCTELVSNLAAQSGSLERDFGFEIIVADDCSTNVDVAEKVRKSVQSTPFCRFLSLSENKGRAGIRNCLAGMSRFDTLLFLDCDAMVCSPDFLADYLAAMQNSDAGVVCGGLRHPDTIPFPGCELRYRYEKKADAGRKAAIRSRRPYAQFSTFSFLIERELFLQTGFDESIDGYGYEDVLFGLELERRKVRILHIDNPLIHLGLEDNATYLAKTRSAIGNLAAHKELIGDGSRLLHTFLRLEKLHLTGTVKVLGRIFDKAMVRNLCGSRPSLLLFSFYKLFILASVANSATPAK